MSQSGIFSLKHGKLFSFLSVRQKAASSQNSKLHYSIIEGPVYYEKETE